MKELLNRPYLLYVGNDLPHKNLKRLILAFKKLVREHHLDYQLVLVIGRKLKIKNNIIFTGFIDDKELDRLYRSAALYVFPSLHEGFGLPPLEAMNRKIPVASSNATCLPEILGDAAIYFNPLDIDDMAEKIRRILSNDKIKKTLIQKGLKQIKKYSWQKMAEKTLGLYSIP